MVLLRARALMRWRSVPGAELPSAAALTRDLRAQAQTLALGITPLDLRIPWMPYSAVRHLDSCVPSSPDVAEFGVGGSTLWWLDRDARLVSIEHDEHWAQLVHERVGPDTCGRWRLHVEPPVQDSSAENVEHPYISTDRNFQGLSFESYVRSIEQYADESFDVVVVDGRARSACLHAAAAKVRVGGHLVLDQSEREEYWSALASLGNRYSVRQFPGPTPGQPHFTQTAIMRRQG